MTGRVFYQKKFEPFNPKGNLSSTFFHSNQQLEIGNKAEGGKQEERGNI